MSNEVEDAIKRICAHKGVVGLIVINYEGIPIKSTVDNALSVLYAAQVQQLVDKSRTMIKELDGNNDLSFIRLRTKKHEVLVAPDKDYALIVIQNPVETSQLASRESRRSFSLLRIFHRVLQPYVHPPRAVIVAS
ncbi:unnamed protein product [Allacma fusca]|uniref:Roadblock/LAMTOR2 domain-containing protein n=1 Tax=Allacma fusca TaxID=39272 RepID=A0A8J2LLR1_9HEXA|nr:unnamed protein product [Allacma fusca]